MTDFPKFRLSFPGENVRMRSGPSAVVTDDHDLPDVKLRALVSFPPNALGGTAVDIAKVNGNFIIDIDYSEIAQAVSVPTPELATDFVLFWNQAQNTYQRISLASLKTALGIP